MLLTRFWNVLISLLLGASVFVLYLAMSMYNRSGSRTMAERLSSDTQVVSWYLKEDARLRAAELIPFALHPELARNLAKASEAEAKVPETNREKVNHALGVVNAKVPPELTFDAVFAIDQHGRVVGQIGYPAALGMDDFELGGYPVVADALRGYIRDDTLVLDRVYRVVARPVELEAGQAPAGAIMGARIIDDRFARELSSRTSAAIGFFARGQRVASGAPEGFDKSQLDQIVGDIDGLESDQAYREKGRSRVRVIAGMLGVQYSRLPGEAWALGAGYAVARLPDQVTSPFGFFQKSDEKDKQQANWVIALLIALGAAVFGIAFSVLEHSRPLWLFRSEAQRLAKGEVAQLHPSKFRGIYRKIAGDLNDGIEHVAAKGGAPRRAADLSQVLGDIPDQPQMSAFSFPGDAPVVTEASAVSNPIAAALPSAPRRSVPKPQPRSGVVDSAAAADEASGAGGPSLPRRTPPRRHVADEEPATAAPEAGAAAAEGVDQAAEWQAVYQDFVALKQQCGEDTENFTFDKFEQTLRKNEQAILSRHAASRVKFSVYIKDGKAALKASPIRDA